jgi:ribosome biogenesis GTPase
MQAVDRDFNVNRLDRYLAICHESNVKPFIVMTKTDLVDGERAEGLSDLVGLREKGIPLVMISNETRAGYDRLEELFVPGKTYCLLGSSGIGKSTLLNNLCGTDVMKTGAISASTDRGRHTTTSREMFLLANGAIVIDTPGLREVGLPAAERGIGMTFSSISDLAERCRFGDCTHTREAGCAVLAALESGELDGDAYANYLKLRKESGFHASTQAERHRKDRDFGKMRKDFLKGRESGDF